MSVENREKTFKLWFRFSDKRVVGSTYSIQENRLAEREGNRIMRQFNERNYFNGGISFYQSLLNKEGCCNVEIRSLCVRHNNFFHGIQVIYRLRYADGSEERHNGPENFFSSGYYSYHGGLPSTNWIHLEENEFLVGLRVNQGEILDGIIFVTNQREILCGGNGGSRYDMMIDNNMNNTKRIVAFSGTVKGVCERIGYYVRSFGWEKIGHYIVLRSMVYRGRAVLKKEEEVEERKLEIRAVMEGLNSLDDDAFRVVMLFLL